MSNKPEIIALGQTDPNQNSVRRTMAGHLLNIMGRAVNTVGFIFTPLTAAGERFRKTGSSTLAEAWHYRGEWAGTLFGTIMGLPIYTFGKVLELPGIITKVITNGLENALDTASGRFTGKITSSAVDPKIKQAGEKLEGDILREKLESRRLGEKMEAEIIGKSFIPASSLPLAPTNHPIIMDPPIEGPPPSSLPPALPPESPALEDSRTPAPTSPEARKTENSSGFSPKFSCHYKINGVEKKGLITTLPDFVNFYKDTGIIGDLAEKLILQEKTPLEHLERELEQIARRNKNGLRIVKQKNPLGENVIALRYDASQIKDTKDKDGKIIETIEAKKKHLKTSMESIAKEHGTFRESKDGNAFALEFNKPVVAFETLWAITEKRFELQASYKERVVQRRTVAAMESLTK